MNYSGDLKVIQSYRTDTLVLPSNINNSKFCKSCSRKNGMVFQANALRIVSLFVIFLDGDIHALEDVEKTCVKRKNRINHKIRPTNV